MNQMGATQEEITGRRTLLVIVPSWMFDVLLLPCFLFVLVLTVATPPMEVPDEMQHIYRAYQISEPTSLGRVQDGVAGADLPSSLSKMTEHFLGTRAIHAARTLHPHPWHDTAAYLGTALQPDQREFTNFGSQIIYSPLGYLPQAASIVLGRNLGWGPLGLLYAVRLANALVALGIIACAIRVLPSGRAMIAAVAFLPMSAYEIASASADGQVIPFAILYTALAARGLRAGSWTSLEVGAAFIAGLIVTTVKFPYLPLLGLGLPALLTQPRRKLTIAFAIGIPLLCGVASLAWLNHVAPLVVVTRPDLPASNASQQVAFLREHPFAFVSIGFHTLAQWKFLLKSMIGNFGWLTSPLPSIGVVIGLVSLICAMLCFPHFKPKSSRLIAVWTAVIFALSVMLTAIATYLTWTPVGHYQVDGLQGRYLLPVLMTLLLGLSTLLSPNLTGRYKRNLECVCLGMVLTNAVLTLVLLVYRFEIFG